MPEDAWVNLYGDVQTLLHRADSSIVKAESFTVEIRGSEVRGSPWRIAFPPGDPPGELTYYIHCNNPPPNVPGFTGWLTIHRTDELHVDVVFRPGAFQLNPAPIAICVDGYNIGAVEWGQGER